MWLCSAMAQKEEFKYGCWIRQIEADPCSLQKKELAKSRQSLKFDKKFSSNQGSRAVALVIEKVIYYSVPVQEVTFQAKE